jgi:hypothetical protein
VGSGPIVEPRLESTRYQLFDRKFREAVTKPDYELAALEHTRKVKATSPFRPKCVTFSSLSLPKTLTDNSSPMCPAISNFPLIFITPADRCGISGVCQLGDG